MFCRIHACLRINFTTPSSQQRPSFLIGINYAKATKNAIVYGHKNWGGIGYFHLYIEQGLSNVKTFITTIQDDNIAGNLLRAAVKTWLWQIGPGYNPFQKS
jgi:hypothetical protein